MFKSRRFSCRAANAGTLASGLQRTSPLMANCSWRILSSPSRVSRGPHSGALINSVMITESHAVHVGGRGASGIKEGKDH